MYNEEATIIKCLDAVVAEMGEYDEVIVLDNGSTDNSINLVKSYYKVQLLEMPRITIAGLRNAGARYAQGDVLAFIDADCVICSGWRNHVVNTFEIYDIAASGSKYALPENSCWIEKAWFSQKRTAAGVISYINSGNLAVKKTAFNMIGGFNEKLITGEDAELGWRLKVNGFVVFENPDVKAIHLGNPKNLWNFYKKQRWHGLGMLGTFNISWFDKPFIMTLIFISCVLITIISIIFNTNASVSYLGPLALITILTIPIITSIFRCIQYKNFTYMPQLVLLYLLYFVARSNSLILICFRAILNNKST